MKKLYTILAIAAVAAVGCTKVETIDNTPGNKITFQTASYVPQTKGEVSVIGEFTSFKSKAFLHADGYDGETQDFFGANGETISPDNTTTPTYWAPSHDYYWPKSSQSYINFIAWYDKKGTAPTVATETNLKWENYTVLTTDNLLFADEAWRYKDNNNSKYNKDSVTEGVPMLFHHALAQLCIKAAVTKNTDGNTPAHTWDVTLEDISLGGVYTQGTLNLTNSDPSTEHTTKAWTGSWTPSGSTTTVDMDDVTTPLTTTATEVLAMQNVLPQDVTDSNVLNLTVKISYKYNNTEYAHEAIDYSIKLSDFTTAVSEWEMNKKITYTLTINPETTVVKLDPAMEEWAAVAGGTYTI